MLGGRGIEHGLGPGPDDQADGRQRRDRTRLGWAAGAQDGLAGHRAGAQVALDLEALAVQHLPLVVGDVQRRELGVDRLELLPRRPDRTRGAVAAACLRGPSARPAGPRCAWASALTVRCAADVVSRLAIAARARATSSGLPEISRSIG